MCWTKADRSTEWSIEVRGSTTRSVCVLTILIPTSIKNGSKTFFHETTDTVRQQLVPEQHTHGQLINFALTEYGTKPYAVILDSDVWFKNSDLMPDLAKLADEHDANDLAAIGHLVQGYPFKLPSTHYNTTRKRWLHRLGEFLVESCGGLYNQPRAKLPRFDPALLWVNRELFVRCKMSFKNTHLDVNDTTTGTRRHYKVLGDNGSSFFFQCAYHDKIVVNVDIRRWCVHTKNVGHDTTSEEIKTDWFSADVKWERGMWKESPHHLEAK